jgi:hypothetical protein
MLTLNVYLKLDEVPDFGERGADDGGFDDRGGGRDWSRHLVGLGLLDSFCSFGKCKSLGESL